MAASLRLSRTESPKSCLLCLRMGMRREEAVLGFLVLRMRRKSIANVVTGAGWELTSY